MLHGSTITLRDWRMPDLDVWAHWLKPDHRWKQFDGPYYPLPTPDERATMLADKRVQIEQGAWPTPRQGLVIADRASDELIGMVGRYWESKETLWLSVGIAIFDSAHWGQGRGYQALGLWSDYLFRAMSRIARLDLRTWSGNHGMMRLAEKVGYQQEARFRKARIVNGEYYDSMGYGVLREEWEQWYPAGFAASEG